MLILEDFVLGMCHCSNHAKNFNLAIAMYVFLIELIVNLDRLESIDIVKFGFSPVIFSNAYFSFNNFNLFKNVFYYYLVMT